METSALEASNVAEAFSAILTGKLFATIPSAFLKLALH